MRERGWGRVIVIGSTGMQHPIPTLALSNTLRASVWGWLKTLSAEVAKDGVTMNVLAPGTILTDRVTQTTTVRAQQQGISLDEALAQAAKEIPAGRLGTPADFGPMGAFLASERGAYITGSMIRVDGGRVRSML
jgi:3-oxoacyl-[acyl-carrier protein] reductase